MVSREGVQRFVTRPVLARSLSVMSASFLRRSTFASAVGVALLVLAAFGLRAALAGGRNLADGPATVRANQQAAVRDSQRLLGRLVLPSGADPLSRTPSGADGLLSAPSASPGLGNADLIDLDRYWIVTDSPAAVTSFIAAHPPAGSNWMGSSSGLVGPGVPSNSSISYDWPPVADVLDIRWLAVTAVLLPNGTTAVRADAEIGWVIPRSATSLVPQQARVLDVTVAPLTAAGKPSLSITVSDLAKVDKLATIMNDLQSVQPNEVWHCPGLPLSKSLATFTFRANAGGPVLARANVPASATAPATSCDAMTLVVRHHNQTPLLDGAAVVRAAQKLLGVTLTSAN
jgi:hypothetical protein